MSASYRAAPTMVGTPMLDNFFTDTTSTVADEVNLYVLTRSNQPNPANTRGSMPTRQVGPGASKKQYSLFHSFNEVTMDANSLRFLRSNDPAIQSIGREWVAATVEEAGRRQKLLREVIIGQIMTYGRVNLDINFNPVIPTVHATTGVITDNASTTVSADFQVADTHRGNCNSLVSGAWDTVTTDIFSELEAIRDAAIKAGAEPPNTVYIHKQRMPKILNNTKFQAWATLNSTTANQVLATGQINNFYGWNFRTLEGYWTDVSGTQRPIIPLRNAIIVPPNGAWKRCKEGTQDVPTSLEIVNDLDAALKTLVPVVGMFSFAQVKVSPLVQCSLFMGDNFGLGFANPNAVWFPTVFAA